MMNSFLYKKGQVHYKNRALSLNCKILKCKARGFDSFTSTQSETICYFEKKNALNPMYAS